ncbi:MAG: hypothetical protein IPG07_13275 [Crocinitomicaceae bacterium]|nr:hypothetical protein [Crocinitomicaceae bacterium]
MRFLNEDGNFKMTYAIGRVRVTAVNGSQLTFEVIEKTGVVTINGVERSNFTEGAVVQFTEYKYDSPHLTETKYESGAIKESGYLLCGISKNRNVIRPGYRRTSLRKNFVPNQKENFRNV